MPKLDYFIDMDRSQISGSSESILRFKNRRSFYKCAYSSEDFVKRKFIIQFHSAGASTIIYCHGNKLALDSKIWKSKVNKTCEQGNIISLYKVSDLLPIFETEYNSFDPDKFGTGW